ncbi:MAG: transcriptional repressor [Oscillospiraceae bacterium]|nr:transcriptional repressor [Oscillospiraceae bacterium]
MEAVTKQFRKRNAILAYLQSTTEHPSAEMVFAGLKPQIPDLSLGTVYRNLNLFRKQGLASCVATVNGVERFDGNTNPHVHFICNECDAVIDLMEMQIPATLTSTAESCSGGQVADCQLSFTGKCRSCVRVNQKGGETA